MFNLAYTQYFTLSQQTKPRNCETANGGKCEDSPVWLCQLRIEMISASISEVSHKTFPFLWQIGRYRRYWGIQVPQRKMSSLCGSLNNRPWSSIVRNLIHIKCAIFPFTFQQ